MTFLGHSRSNVVVSLDAPYMLFMFTSNMWPNSTPLQDTKLRNLSDLDFDLSKSPRVKYDGVTELSVRFLLTYITYMYIITCLPLTVYLS